eukprot:SAG11_NODE_139_length_15111_cov_9.482214_5_plen_89_part_00
MPDTNFSRKIGQNVPDFVSPKRTVGTVKLGACHHALPLFPNSGVYKIHNNNQFYAFEDGCLRPYSVTYSCSRGTEVRPYGRNRAVRGI